MALVPVGCVLQLQGLANLGTVQKGENLTTTKERVNPNRTARIVGFLYVLVIPLGLLGIMQVPTVLVVAGDAATTTENILADIGLFRLSIVTALVVQVAHIFIVLLLYGLLKPVNKNFASLMVVFLLVGVPITMLNKLRVYPKTGLS